MRDLESPVSRRPGRAPALLLGSACLLAAAAALAGPATPPASSMLPPTTEFGPMEITLGGGAALPQGSFSDHLESGSVLFAGLAWRLFPGFVLGGEVDWHRFQPSRALESQYPADDVDFSILTYAGSAKIVLTPGPARFYLRGLVGQYETRLDVQSVGERLKDYDRRLGWAAGAGVQIMGEDEAALCFEALYHRIPGDDVERRPDVDFITVGASMLFFGP